MQKIPPNKESILRAVATSIGDDWVYSEKEDAYGYRHDLLVSAKQRSEQLEVFYGEEKIGTVNLILENARIQESYDEGLFDIKPKHRIPKP
jgi:hypothetical protein